MRKGSVCAIAAALLIATGGVSEAQAAVVPVNGTKVNCSTVEELKNKLQQMNVECDSIWELISKFDCGSLPEVNVPSLPEQPDTPENNLPQFNFPSWIFQNWNVPVIPEQPDENAPIVPEVPEATPTPEVKPEVPEVTPTPEVKPETPEVQDQAYAYGLRITELVNEHRTAAGLAPVQYSAQVSKAAQTRAVEIEKSFSHTRPDGRYFSTVFAEHGLSYRYAGENIAWGQKSPEEVVTAWMNSAGHRANIMNAKFTTLGVGYRQNARGVNYFTQLFLY